MNEIGFAGRHLGEYRIKGDEIQPKFCPYCQGGQNNDKYTFALNYQNHTFNCLRGSCGRSGHFSQLCKDFGETSMEKPYTPPVKRDYKKPSVAMQAPDKKSVEYMRIRGLTEETAKAFGISEDANGNMIFPYYRTADDFENKAATFLKYRKPHKLQKGERKMWREADTEPILFGMHLCDLENGFLFLFEGEFDAMCGYQATKSNCVSVPSGCEDFTWIDTCYEWLELFKIIVVMADNDEAGRKMLRELSLKLECEVQCPDFDTYMGCKDANEILVRHGAEQLVEAMASVSPVAIQGLLNLAEVQALDIDKLPRALSGIPALDRATGGLLMGDLSVWTGKRGEGKSTILTQIMLDAIDQGHTVCAYSGEVPAERFKYIVNLQAAGSAFAQEREDNSTGRQVQYVPKVYLPDIERWYNGRFWLYDNKIIETDEAESIIRIFEAAYRRYNSRVFLVDNLMTVSTCRSDRDYYQLQADFTIRLRKLAEKLGVHVHLVVHPRKGQITDGDAVGGLSVITNIACNVFSMRRIHENEMEEYQCNSIVTCLKNRAYGENVAVKLNYAARSRRFVQQGYHEKVLSWTTEEQKKLAQIAPNPFLEEE